MRVSTLSLLAGVSLALTACGEAGEAEPALEGEAPVVVAPTAAPTDAGMMDPAADAAGMRTIAFTSVGSPEHRGEVMLHPMGGQTEITVRLSGPQSGTHQGHIHSGTCDNLGPPVQPLEPVEVPQSGQGTSTTTVNIPPATVMNGEHLVAYHDAGGAPVVCAEIPAGAA